VSVYILHEYKVKMPDGTKPCIMTADNEKELHTVAELIYATKEQFNDTDGGKFYIITRSQMKRARNNGALTGHEAREMIRFKKQFPIMKQHEAE